MTEHIFRAQSSTGGTGCYCSLAVLCEPSPANTVLAVYCNVTLGDFSKPVDYVVYLYHVYNRHTIVSAFLYDCGCALSLCEVCVSTQYFYLCGPPSYVCKCVPTLLWMHNKHLCSVLIVTTTSSHPQCTPLPGPLKELLVHCLHLF